jgi:hypothetical protein
MRLLVAVIIVCGAAGAADAGDCYQVEKGTRLYAEVMGDTVVGTATAPVIGWFGRVKGSEPTIWLRFVALDGDVLLRELDVYVKKEDAKAVTCPAAWRRGGGESVDLGWPDARHAGTAVRGAIEARRKKGKKKYGRSCFVADVPGVAATVCVPLDERAKTTCVAIAAGKEVFARASTAAKLGTTTERVFAEYVARVDDLLAVTAVDAEGAQRLYVRRADTRAARCPVFEEEEGMGQLGAIPPFEALLPDGTDAGFRIIPLLGNTEEVVAGGRTLRCFDQSPVTGLALRICYATSDP